jgi:hypothetical protein
MPLTNVSRSNANADHAIFVIDLQDTDKKIIYKKVFLLITFWKYIYIIFKDKKSKRSHKAVGIKVFLTIFAWRQKRPGSGSIPLTNGSGSVFRRPKTCRSGEQRCAKDPADRSSDTDSIFRKYRSLQFLFLNWANASVRLNVRFFNWLVLLFGFQYRSCIDRV